MGWLSEVMIFNNRIAELSMKNTKYFPKFSVKKGPEERRRKDQDEDFNDRRGS